MHSRASIVFAGALSFLAAACSSVSYRYVPDKPLHYTQQVKGKTIKRELAPLYHNLRQPGVISSLFIFSESQATWKEMKSIEIELYDGDKRLPLRNSKTKISYWNGKRALEKDIKDDFRGYLYELYPPELESYQYNDTMPATFTFEFQYEAEKFPEQLTQKIIIRFKDKDLNFENTLRKQKSEKPFISGRPFG